MAKSKAKPEAKAGIKSIGRVIKNTGSSYVVKLEDGSILACRVKGNFRIKGIRTTNPVAVGDIVEVATAADDASYIVKVLPRTNYIIRKASNLSKESHILAANIDLAVLVATVREPATPTTFIDRFLATAEAYDIPAALVINKSDLWDEIDREYAEALKSLYESMGYKVFFLSCVEKDGLESLKSYLKNKISLLAGNSGVGKSSIINCLVPDLNLKTGEISDIHHTGTHTTTFSEMIDLPEGGAVIDIPGVRGFGTLEFKPEETGHYFPEIFRFSSKCKYGNCKHTTEPGCAVKEAVENNFIAQSRYNSYLSILEDAMESPGADKYRKPF